MQTLELSSLQQATRKEFATGVKGVDEEGEHLGLFGNSTSVDN